LGIGVRRLSADPQFLPQVQQIIRRLTLSDATAYAQMLLSESSLKATRDIMDRYLASVPENERISPSSPTLIS
jgi:phosphotransferase system enzyme I (PtsP)